MVALNSKHEVSDFLDVSQFIPGRSAYECCAYAASLVKYCGRPGQGPSGTALEASNLAQYWYGRETGSDSASNMSGMSLQQEYDMLKGMGLVYEPLTVSVDAVKGAIAKGLAVLLCGAEAGMYDVDLGDIVPYSWHPSGNHCIVVSGIASDGNLLVHDTANIGSSGVRPGPREYDASKLQLVSATAVTPPWQGESMTPDGWHDDGVHLTAPNGHYCREGFREYVLAHNWDAANVPLEEEVGMSQLEASNPSLGGGTRQTFNWTMLEWTQERGVFVAWCGKELLYTRQQYANIYAAYQALKEQQSNPQLLSDMQAVKAIATKY